VCSTGLVPALAAAGFSLVRKWGWLLAVLSTTDAFAVLSGVGGVPGVVGVQPVQQCG
jgi:hypothetical protein